MTFTLFPATATALLNRLRRHAPLLVWALYLSIMLLMPHLAHASTSDSSSGSLPWESPLKSLRESFSGPVAYALAIIGIVVTGGMLIWGGEINEFARRGIMLVLVVSFIVLANSVLTSLFSSAATLDMASGSSGDGTVTMWTVAVIALTFIAYRRLLARPRLTEQSPR
jgi:type IV secretion system protein VirB2